QAVYTLARVSGGAAQPMQLYLIKLKLSDGSLIWRHYLCTIAHAGYSVGTLDVLTAMAGGEIYIATGKGADMAVDATLGRILWLHLTPSDHTPQQAVYWGQMKRTPPWQLNAPIVADGRLFVADSGRSANGTIRIYNRWTGQLLQTLPCNKLSDARISVGVLNHQLILVGHRVVGVNIDSGQTAWRSPEIERFGKLAGRPMLSRDQLYVPLTTGLLLVSTAGGPAAPKLIAWPAGLHNQPGQPGNILVTRQEVLVVGDTFASGLARWQTALAYNQARIDKHPDAVEPRLTLAEIAFRTQHYNMSQRLIQQAANLASSQGQGNLLLNRIFRISLDFGHRLGLAAATQPRSRFYLTIAQQTARDPQQQVQWRMEMASLDLRTGQVARAMSLLQQVLSRDAYRQAPLRLANATMLAGIAAEGAIARALTTPAGRTAYQTFEDQAQQQLLQAGHDDEQPLAAIMRRYPNSQAAMSAAWRLATMQAAAAHWRLAGRTLNWLQRRATGREQAKVVAQLSVCARQLGRWNLALQLAQRGLQEYPTFEAAIDGRRVNFARLVSTLISQAPAGALVHLPQLNWTLHSGFTILTPVSGSLMRPIETSPRYQRGDIFMVQQVQGQATSILAINSQTGEELWHYRLRHMAHAALMGYVGQTAVFITSSRAFGLNAATGKELWSQGMAQQAEKKLPNPIMGPQVFMAGGPIFINNQFLQQQMNGNNAYLANQMARRRQERLSRALGAMPFGDVRLTRSRLLMLGPQQISAISIATGQPAWPESRSLAHWGTPQHLVVAANRIVVLMGLPAATLVILKASDGKLAGVIHLPPGDPAYWARVGTGGTLYAAGLHGVLAYDLQGGLEAPLWYRRHLTMLLPGASQLTQDGVIVVHGGRLECLNRQDGRTRWRTTAANLSDAPGITAPTYTLLNQDTVIVRTSADVMAFATGSGHVRWRVNFAGQTPPVRSMRLADPDLAILGQGPLG
ncbi:MAG: PQQ-binding-like beta-propeller repeat protein, partial [Phycisphaerales bacterium]|nr:PQQ-binding-like beta-propeller repeat protein [Phycisphaerales bacterium]